MKRWGINEYFLTNNSVFHLIYDMQLIKKIGYNLVYFGIYIKFYYLLCLTDINPV